MSMTRRDLLKKGGALGAAAAVAAAVGTVAVAPTAQASGYWWNRLWNHYLPGDVYGWDYMRPKAWGTYQEVFVGNWSWRMPENGLSLDLAGLPGGGLALACPAQRRRIGGGHRLGRHDRRLRDAGSVYHLARAFHEYGTGRCLSRRGAA